MTERGQDELQVLRERAYGPAADIHLDSDALERLRELESRDTDPVQATTTVHDPLESSPSKADPAAPAPGDIVTSAAEPARRASRLGRATLLIMLGLVALIVVCWTVLVLVNRVQSDPLQTGATQVARLSEDSTYEIPKIFASQSFESDTVQAYQEFYGLRAVFNPYGASDGCIMVFPSENAVDAGGNFVGPGYSGCSAGAFPAAIAFTVTSELPEQLRSEFPDGTALQFVLDEANREVVVFTDR